MGTRVEMTYESGILSKVLMPSVEKVEVNDCLDGDRSEPFVSVAFSESEITVITGFLTEEAARDLYRELAKIFEKDKEDPHAPSNDPGSDSSPTEP